MLLPFLFSSCENFLDKRPRHQWPVDQAMQSYDKAVQAVNGIYGQFMQGDNLNQAFYSALATKSGYISLTGNLDLDMSYNEMNNSKQAEGLWSIAYKAINCANLAINEIPNIDDSSFPTQEAKSELIAEARLLRGYLNSILMLNFCYWWNDDDSPYGLVYRDQVTNASNIIKQRITVGESWNKIFEDLDFAITNMSDDFITPRKVSKFFAKAWKSKLLLIRGVERNSEADLLEAKNLLMNALSNIPNKIMIDQNMRDHFTKSWNSSENIFVRYLEDVAGRTYNAGYYCDYALGYSGSTNFLNSAGVEVSQADAQCGLKYGLDWMREDPRWYYSTGKARKPETWDNTYCWTWTKIYRKGRYGGQNSTPKDENYAVYHLRLPELYIMMAELIARTGGTMAESIHYINEMRSKRVEPSLNQISEPLSKSDLMDIIYKEYINELFLENGSELYASIRFYKDGERYINIVKGGNNPFEISKLQWPIPNAEIINNPLVEQNPNQG